MRSVALAVAIWIGCFSVSAQTSSRDEWFATVRRANSLYNGGKTTESEAIYRKALIEAERLSIEPAETAVVWGSLGTVYWQLGRIQDSENARKRGLGLIELLIPGDPLVVLLSAELLSFFVRTNQLGKAEQLEKHCRESAWWRSSAPGMARMLNAVGMLRCAEHRFDEAESILKLALSSEQSRETPQPAVRSVVLSNLGAVYFGSARFGDAIRVLNDLLQEQEASSTLGGPAKIQLLEELGLSCRAAGRAEDSGAALEKALAMARCTYPPDHPVVGHLLAEYAKILRDLHRKHESKIAAREARGILRESVEMRSAGLLVDVADLARSSARP